MDFYGFEDDAHTPRYTGHETFNLRYGWLKKAYDAVVDESVAAPFKDEGAIARFGVGKNMVSAMKHWALNCGVIVKADSEEGWCVTELGNFIFDSATGIDPYLETTTSLWLLHYRLASRSEKTLLLYAFNFFPELSFSRESLAVNLLKTVHSNGIKVPSEVTLKKDIANLISTYCIRSLDKKVKVEDIISAPLAELCLISQTGSTSYSVNKGTRADVPNGVFAYALDDFWRVKSPGTTTLSFEAICFEPYGPGRIFALSPDEIVTQLKALEDTTTSKMRWVESAGVKTVMRSSDFAIKPLEWVVRPFAFSKGAAA